MEEGGASPTGSIDRSPSVPPSAASGSQGQSFYDSDDEVVESAGPVSEVRRSASAPPDSPSTVTNRSTVHAERLLPCMEHREHPQFPCISPAILRKLLLGELCIEADEVVVVDCRYEYEYNGGHIEGALHLPRGERQVRSHFYLSDGTPTYPPTTVIIFHCEFSSKRGPAALKALRSIEMERFAEGRMARDYPEVYLLNGGYKAYYEWERSEGVADDESLCTPVGYTLMRDKAFFDEMSAAVRQERQDARELRRSKSAVGSRGRRHASLSLSMSDIGSGLHPGASTHACSPSPTGRRTHRGRGRRGSTGPRNIFGDEDEPIVDPNAVATTPVRPLDDTGLMSPAPRPARLSFGRAMDDTMDEGGADADNTVNRGGRRTMPPPSNSLTQTSYW